MRNNLIKKIRKDIFLPLIFVGAISGCGETYNIGEREIRKSPIFNMKEKYHENKIIYIREVFDMDSELKKVDINGRLFTQKDSVVFFSAKKRYIFLKDTIKKIDKEKYNPKIEKN